MSALPARVVPLWPAELAPAVTAWQQPVDPTVEDNPLDNDDADDFEDESETELSGKSRILYDEGWL